MEGWLYPVYEINYFCVDCMVSVFYVIMDIKDTYIFRSVLYCGEKYTAFWGEVLCDRYAGIGGYVGNADLQYHMVVSVFGYNSYFYDTFAEFIV